MLRAETKPAWPAMWTSRVALFGAGLVVAALVLHRLFWMPTAVALNLVAVGYGLAILAVLLALLGMAIVWRRGTPGVSRILFALAVALTMLAWPAALWPTFSALPAINDISTDTSSPPPFPTLAKARADGRANSARYPGKAFAEAQSKAYPDIAPMIVERPVEETYELVVTTLQRMKMRVVNEELPDPRAGQAGIVEATDRTMILGFVDDVVMRITPDGRRSRVDIRSASRYGRHDLGRNALRIRTIARELTARVEATVPIPSGEGPRAATAAAGFPKREKGKLGKQLVPKRPKERDPTIIAPKPLPDPARADAPRAPEPKGKQRSQDAGRGRDRRQ
jgi:uncharacterized protein (DUF1499 family)